jgi:hypothetical protein
VARVMPGLVLTTGIACVGIGLAHLALGIASVPGEGAAGATVDSRERFYGAIFCGYGLAWVWAARQVPVPARAVRCLAGILVLGGVGRLVSLAVYGAPHGFQLVLTAIELVLPPVLWLMAGVDENRGEHRSPGTAPAPGQRGRGRGHAGSAEPQPHQEPTR